MEDEGEDRGHQQRELPSVPPAQGLQQPTLKTLLLSEALFCFRRLLALIVVTIVGTEAALHRHHASPVPSQICAFCGIAA